MNPEETTQRNEESAMSDSTGVKMKNHNGDDIDSLLADYQRSNEEALASGIGWEMGGSLISFADRVARARLTEDKLLDMLELTQKQRDEHDDIDDSLLVDYQRSNEEALASGIGLEMGPSSISFDGSVARARLTESKLVDLLELNQKQRHEFDDKLFEMRQESQKRRHGHDDKLRLLKERQQSQKDRHDYDSDFLAKIGLVTQTMHDRESMVQKIAMEREQAQHELDLAAAKNGKSNAL